MPTNSTHERIATYIKEHEELTYSEIAKALNISYSTVARLAAAYGIRRQSGKRLVIDDSLLGL